MNLPVYFDAITLSTILAVISNLLLYIKGLENSLIYCISSSLKVENILIKFRKFSLPGNKKLLDSSLEDNLIVMDVMESPIEKPKKYQKGFYSGKQGEHTLKTQVVLEQKSEKIICLEHGKGRVHDLRLFCIIDDT